MPSCKAPYHFGEMRHTFAPKDLPTQDDPGCVAWAHLFDQQRKPLFCAKANGAAGQTNFHHAANRDGQYIPSRLPYLHLFPFYHPKIEDGGGICSLGSARHCAG